MKLSQLENNIKNKKSFLCLGLDSDIDKIPKHLLGNSDPVFEFNKILIDELNQKIVAVNLILLFMKVEVLLVGHLWKRPLIILINFTQNCLQLQMQKEEILEIHQKCMPRLF